MRINYLLLLLAGTFVGCAPATNNQSGSVSWVRSVLFPNAADARTACDKAAEDAKKNTRDNTYGVLDVKLTKGGFTFSSSLSVTYGYCLRYFELGGSKTDTVIARPIIFMRDTAPERVYIGLISSEFLKIGELNTQEIVSNPKTYTPVAPTAQQIDAMNKADRIEIRFKFASGDETAIMTREMFQGRF